MNLDNSHTKGIDGLTIRQRAQASGLSTYYTGRPCFRGHFSERRVKGGGCIECESEPEIRELKRANSRAYFKRKYVSDPKFRQVVKDRVSAWKSRRKVRSAAFQITLGGDES